MHSSFSSNIITQLLFAALEDKYQMSELRKKIPSVTLVLLTIHENPDDTKLGESELSYTYAVKISEKLLTDILLLCIIILSAWIMKTHP